MTSLRAPGLLLVLSTLTGCGSVVESTFIEITVEPSSTTTAPSVADWTSVEDELLAGVRADVRAAACRPLRVELPSGAEAAVDCVVGSDLVNRVGFYRFVSLEPLMAVYETQIAEQGVPLSTPAIGELPDDCWRGAEWDSFYAPAGDATGGQNRVGCFVDEDGFANLRYIWGRSDLYLEVLGANADIAALQAWAWYNADGTEPVLGGPGVWQPPT